MLVVKSPLSVRGIAMLVVVAFALGGFCAVLLGLLVAPPVLRDDLGSRPAIDPALSGPTNSLYGFYDAERNGDGLTYRWTNSSATYTFPYAAYLGRNVVVRLRMTTAGAPAGYSAEVKVLLNGQAAGAFQVTPTYQVYQVSLDTRQTPNPYLEPAHVQIEVASSTFVSPADGRVLGVNVDWLELQAERSRIEIVIEAGVWALVLGLIVLAAAIRLRSLAWVTCFGLSALISFVILNLTYLPRGVPPATEIALAGLAWLVGVWSVPRRSPAWGLVITGIGLWLVVAGRLLGEWQLDDAYISYRYAWNLVHGNGLVYNLGEQVEGYTNFLWTLLSAIPIALQLSPAAVTLGLNISLNIALVGLTWQVGVRLAKGSYIWPAVSCTLLSIDSAIVTYGARGSGMESMLFAVLVLLAAALLFHSGRHKTRFYVAGGFALALATLTRPEGLLAAAIFISVRALQEWRAGRRVGRTLIAAILPLLAVLVPYEVWRITFYGYPLPNTFYTKTGATLALISRGWDYMVVFRSEHWLLLPLAAIGVVLFSVRGRTSEILTALSIFALLQTLYVVWVGGDHFPGWRFLVPVIAPIVLVAQETVRRGLRLLPSTGYLRTAAAALVALAALVYCSDAIWLEEATGVSAYLTALHTGYVERWGSAGLWLRANTAPGTVIAAKGAGAIAYYGQRPTVDMFGITDLHIGHLSIPDMGEKDAGHDKTDPAYVLSRNPAYILSEWASYFDPLKSTFQSKYQPQTVLSPTGVPTDWMVLQNQGQQSR